LTGVDFQITHLDGSKVRIQNKPGEIIKPDDIKTVLGKGLPFHKQAFKFGNLFVLFKVTFPATLNKTQIAGIATSLSTMKSPDVDMSTAETVMLSDYNETVRNTRATGGQ
jgi:DnaJ family protein A protein 2